jgi:hypothetical protein
VCVMRHMHIRVACVRIDLTAARPELVVTPLSTDDPLVAKPVYYWAEENPIEGPVGVCATCLGFNMN